MGSEHYKNMEHNDGFPDKYYLLPELETVFDRLKRLGRKVIRLSPIETAHFETPEEYIDMIAGAKHSELITPDTHPELFEHLDVYFSAHLWENEPPNIIRGEE